MSGVIICTRARSRDGGRAKDDRCGENVRAAREQRCALLGTTRGELRLELRQLLLVDLAHTHRLDRHVAVSVPGLEDRAERALAELHLGHSEVDLGVVDGVGPEHGLGVAHHADHDCLRGLQ